MKKRDQLEYRRTLKLRLKSLETLADVITTSGRLGYLTKEDAFQRRLGILDDMDETRAELNGHHPMDFFADIRTTFRYTQGYAALDDWEPCGTFRLLSRRNVPPTKADYINGTADQVITVRAPRGIGLEQIILALGSYFSRGCRCEHDCCACWQTTAGKVRHIKAREYQVDLHHYQNI